MNRAFAWLLPFLLLGCEGPAGPLGPEGPSGNPGDSGQDGEGGEDGEDGQDGQDGQSPWLAGPGLLLEVQSAGIAGDGTVTATFQITDASGTPLDLDGVYTEGAVSPRFVFAWLDETAEGEPLQYTAYTTSDQTSPITSVTETQASADSGGSFATLDLASGTYTYEFGTKVTAPESGKTHTVGVYATRDFEDKRYVANTTFDFLPSGDPVEVTRQVVENDACNRCHNPLAVHGGSRRDIDLCILCHSPQTVDPDTGNTVDFPIMIHKIHRGADLDQVAEGKPYEIIGYGQRSHDYSTVHFPQAIQRCEACHSGADADLWKTRPSKAVCGSCHDGISYVDPPPEGKELHSGGAQPDDAPCEFCHPATGSLAGMIESHYTPATDPASPKVELDIVSVETTGPGQQPELTFSVMVDGAPRDISTSPLASLRATVAGPTSDYRESWQVNIQSEGTLIAEDASAGLFRYVFPASKAMPDGATGTYAFGMEGYVQPGGSGPRFAAFNPIAYAAVTDASPAPRRQVVYESGCNDCHFDLALHGGSRKNPEYCTMCHNPNTTGAGRVRRVEGETVVAEPVDFKVMVHKIHRGEDLIQDYVLGGFPPPSTENPVGSPIDFSHLRFPGDLRACWSCHAANTFDLPLAPSVLSSRSEILTCEEDEGIDEDLYCDDRSSEDVFTPPTTAVCTSCHDGPSTAAHAEIMTTMSGEESCTTCHGPGAAFDIAAAHALDP